MKFIIVAAFVGLLAIAYARPEEDHYTDKFDNVDIDGILTNDRLLKNYIACLNNDEKAKCTPDGTELKKVLPEALKTKCAKCSEPQKEKAEKVIKFLIEKRREDFDKLTKIYDPENHYKEQYADFAKEKGITL